MPLVSWKYIKSIQNFLPLISGRFKDIVRGFRIILQLFNTNCCSCVLSLFFSFVNCFGMLFVTFEWKGILAEGDICASQRRASSESLGYLARFGNDIFTARMASSFSLLFKRHVLHFSVVTVMWFNFKKPLPYIGSIYVRTWEMRTTYVDHTIIHGQLRLNLNRSNVNHPCPIIQDRLAVFISHVLTWHTHMASKFY